MYVIVVGAGDIGRPLIDIATRSGNEVVVIEQDAARADAIADDYDCLVLHADATKKEILADAGAEKADAVISTTDQDPTNIMISLLSKEFEIPAILSVVHNPSHMDVFREIGVNTMENPQQLIAEYLYRAVARPAIGDFMRVGEEAEVFEIEVATDAPVTGKTLNEAASEGIIGDDTLVVAVERDGAKSPITPRGNTRLQVGDLVTVYSGVGAAPGVTDVFGHDEDR
jgi:trk system potassium uptake protein TrkA